jgi:hypothetical protein
VTEQFEASSSRAARRRESARRGVIDELAGRTVWSATALPGGRDPIERLARRLGFARGGGVELAAMEVPADERLLGLARRLGALLHGSASPTTGPDRADSEIYAEAVSRADALVARGVAFDDVVVLDDTLAPALAHAVRGRGAHAVWQVDVGAPQRSATTTLAWAFLRPYASAIDAYLMTWSASAGREPKAQRVVALMPSLDRVTAAQLQPEHGPGLGWSGVLADVVQSDRDDRVGGTRHARPAVPSR